jgi:hypothetical protein
MIYKQRRIWPLFFGGRGSGQGDAAARGRRGMIPDDAAPSGA